MNRRDFLRSFSAVPIAAAFVAPMTRTIFLPPRGGWVIGIDQFGKYLTSNTAWFLPDYPRGTPLQLNRSIPYSNALSPDADLSEASLEQLLIDIQKPERKLVVRPTYRIVTKEEFVKVRGSLFPWWGSEGQ